MNKSLPTTSKWQTHYEKYAPLLLATAIFLIRLPPVFFLPVGSQFQTHNLFRSIITGLFVMLVILKRGRIFPKQHIGISLLVVLLFVAESVSVVAASNMSSFITVYKDVLFSIMVFVVTANTIRREHVGLLVYTYIAATAVNMIFEYVTYFAPAFTLSALQPFFYDRYWQFFSYQVGRNRYFGDAFDEITIPLLFYFFFSGRNKANRIIPPVLAAAVAFITVVSNWRTKAIVFAAVSLWTVLLYIKRTKIALLFVLIGLAAFIIANSISATTVGFNVIDRFLLSDGVQIQTAGGRLSYWQQAAELGLTHPLTGVGLGNYYDNLSQVSKQSNQASMLNRTILVDDPHDVFMSLFATTGFIGLALFTLLTLVFAAADIRSFRPPQQMFIIMFWGLFIFALLNPFQYASFLYLFWLLRGVITGLNNHGTNT